MGNMKLSRILSISRYRFWVYELGPFAYGVFAGVTTLMQLLDPKVFIFALFFLFSANLYIYGINDIFDYETDIKNPRKVEYEALVRPEEWGVLWLWISVSVIPFLFFVPFMNVGAVLSILAFFFFAGFYSAKPIRAKARPFFDSVFSAGHYVATGAFGYYLVGGTGFPYIPLLAGMAWAIAMHAYSAVPDISADSGAGLRTIATTFGRSQTIILCLALYVLSAVLTYLYFGIVSIVLGIVYASLMLTSLRTKTEEELLKLYTYFPYLNGVAGMIIFFSILHFAGYL
jgi:lycopene elongase/hydratase (dihydrobisanhydrobacterioruberin-forming)